MAELVGSLRVARGVSKVRHERTGGVLVPGCRLPVIQRPERVTDVRGDPRGDGDRG